MKSKRAKKPAPEAEQEASETDRSLWFLGRELKGTPKADKAEKKPDAETAPAKKADKAEKPQQEAAEPPGERRPSQLEAYMRYAKMREPREDDSLAPIKGRRFPPDGHDIASNENDIWNDEAPRRRPPRRASGGLRLREAILAGVASIVTRGTSAN